MKVFAGDVSAVDDISLRIEDGEFMVLVGPSGCGKSTLLRLIAGLEEADAGAISIGGATSPTCNRASATSRWCSRATRSTRICPSARTSATASRCAGSYFDRETGENRRRGIAPTQAAPPLVSS